MVALFGQDEIFELATLRSTLKVMAAHLALQRPETSEVLPETLPDMDRAAAAQDLKAFAMADRRFHEALVECSGHRRLLKSHPALPDQIELALLNLQRRERSISQIVERHRQLLMLVPEPASFVDALKRSYPGRNGHR